MRLSFGKLRIQHFALFREPQVIDLGRAPGLYYVRGVNQVEPKLGANDCGKALADSIIIDTPVGKRRWGDLREGDRLFGADGRPTIIKKRFPQGRKQLYKVKFDDGSSTICCEDHLWEVSYGSAAGSKRGTTTTLSTKQLVVHGLKSKQGARKFNLPTVEPVRYQRQKLPIDPYLLGMWLGNGTGGGGTISVNSFDLDVIKRLADIHYLKQGSKYLGRQNVKYYHQHCPLIRIYGLARKLKYIGLLGLSSDLKFIPSIFLEASIDQRLELLRGLMDSDGYARPTGGYQFYSTSKKLIEQVVWLVRSLGGKSYTGSVKRGTYKTASRVQRRCKLIYTAGMRLETFVPFFCKRKATRVQKAQLVKKLAHRWIDDIVPLGKKDWCSCVVVDAPDGLFIANDFIVTHNSTIFKALCYVLFGQASPQLKSTDIKPWNDHDGKLQVSLEVFCGDNEQTKKHHITRGAKPSSIIVDSQQAGQADVGKLIGLSFETFTNTILLAQGAELFLDLTPANKMKMFSDVLGLERWDARSRFASATVADLAKRQAEWRGELTGLQSSRDQLKELEGKARQDAEAWEATRQEVLTKADKEIAALKADIAKVQRIVDEASLSMDGAGTEAKALQNELDKSGLELLGYQTDLAEIDQRSAVVSTRAKELQQEIKSLSKAEVCPTCGQKIKGDLTKHKNELEDKHKQLFIQSGQFAVKRMAIEKNIERLQRSRTKTNERFHDFRDREERAQDVLTNAKPRLIGCQNKAALLKQQREQYRNDDNPHQAQMRDLKKRRAKVAGDMEELQEDLTKLSRRIERTQFWVKGFKELQLQVIEETLEELTMATNATLPEMGLEDWSIEYAVERETKSGSIRPELNAAILSPYNREPAKWESWGGGVGQRLRVAGSLALSEVLLNHAGLTTDIEILDEPSKHVSAEGIEDMIEMLAERAGRLGKTIWFVDHRLHESTAFAGTVVVTKTKQGSIIGHG